MRIRREAKIADKQATQMAVRDTRRKHVMANDVGNPNYCGVSIGFTQRDDILLRGDADAVPAITDLALRAAQQVGIHLAQQSTLMSHRSSGMLQLAKPELRQDIVEIDDPPFCGQQVPVDQILDDYRRRKSTSEDQVWISERQADGDGCERRLRETRSSVAAYPQHIHRLRMEDLQHLAFSASPLSDVDTGDRRDEPLQRC